MTDLPTSGLFAGRVHRFPIRVYYADTDAGGVVYHSSYLNFAERARTEMTRLLGLDQVKLRAEQDLLFAVRSAEIDYLRPARLDDVLEVRSCVEHLGGASLHVRQTIYRGDEELVGLLIKLVCMTGSAKAARIPQDLRDRFQTTLPQETD